MNLSFSLRYLMILLATWGAMLVPPVPGSDSAMIGVALADNDDDDDDNDNDDDDDDDDYRRPKQRAADPERRPPRRAAPIAAASYAANEIVAAGIAAQSLAELVNRGYAVLEQDIGFTPDTLIVRLRAPSGMTIEAARSEVRAIAAQGTADFNHYFRPSAANCDSAHCRTISLVGWPASASHGECGGTVKIGMVDTDINVAHPALALSAIDLIKLHDGENGSAAQHGTAVAAILVGAREGRSPGILPKAQLIAVDAFKRIGRDGERADAFAIARAIAMLASRDVSVMNLSLAGPANTVVEHAVRRAAANDIVIVAAAGNEGPRAKPVFPAAYDDVIAVTAVDGALRVYRRAGQGSHIDFAAPGVGIWTAASIRGAKSRTGTSFAAPFVSAAAALIRAQTPQLDRAEVQAKLSQTARDLGKPGRDTVYGDGLLQAGTFCNAQSNAAERRESSRLPELIP